MKRLVIFLIVSCASSMPVVAADNPLDARVTIDYRDTPAADVIRMLARGAGIGVQGASAVMRPVTITLTNVRLSNALNAICDNALCVWDLEGRIVHVRPLPSEQSASLPPRLSFDIDATAPDVFRALAAAIGVAVTIEPGLQSERTNVSFKNALTIDVLDFLCEPLQCEWDFDAARGLRVTKKR